MIQKRASDERGHFDHGWLRTYHTFSFADYYDPAHVHFRSLRVINEDFVKPGMGFGAHPHRDMEIITYILEGSLEHKDSMGTGSVIRPGDVQHMSAGTGVYHSEFNPSTSEPVHLMQIWIMPERQGITPRYQQKSFAREERLGRLKLVASKEAREESIAINQDADLYLSLLDNAQSVSHKFKSGRAGYLQVARGSITVNDQKLVTGDGAEITGASEITITGTSSEQAEILLFDLK